MQTRTTLTTDRQGETLVLTAHVTDALGRALPLEPGASVSFETTHGSLGSALLDADGAATLPLTSLPSEPQALQSALAVRALYHPASDFASTQASLSPAALLQPQASGVPDFTVTANPSSLSTPAGQFATSVLTIAPQFGFNEEVTLSCSNLPAQVTCTFSPVIGSTAAGAFTSTLQVQTQAASGALTPAALHPGQHLALAWLLPGVLALGGFASSRRRVLSRLSAPVRFSALALLLTASVAGLSGCNPRYGYEHHPPSVAPGTPAGVYTLLVAASGNNGSAVTQHNFNLTLTVK
ncbi:MAG TPA: Ig-like domain-containing protein [Acidobacteriaceae bacterium]